MYRSSPAVGGRVDFLELGVAVGLADVWEGTSISSRSNVADLMATLPMDVMN